MPRLQGSTGGECRAPVSGRGFRAKLRREVAEACRCLDGALSPEAVHAARLALKRARALARVGEAWAARAAADFHREAQALLGALGTRRDADVQHQTVLQVDRTAPLKLRAELRALAFRGAGRRRVAEGIRVEDLRVAARKLRALAEGWPRTPRGGLVAGIARVIRRARRGWTSARGTSDARARHRWRRREKERLHVAQLLSAAWPTEVRQRLRVNRKLDAALGEEHDLVLLQLRLQARASGRTPRSGRRHLGSRIESLRRRAEALGRALHEGHA
jgi:CHAD domain-containing protein